MPHHGLSDAERHARAIQAARRMVARAERPCYRLVALPNGSWTVDGLPGATVTTAGRRDALATMRAAIGAVLDVPADAFDVET